MPIYEYECSKCGVFEHSQRIKDPALTKCPTCRRKVRRLISNTSFQLKGSGWYVTDYARGGKKDSAEGGSDGKSESSDGKSESSDGKSESKTDAKPDAKKESKKSDSKAGSGSGNATASVS
jgi:putative FmdB family regulatory protein